jgi:hypothetical protein
MNEESVETRLLREEPTPLRMTRRRILKEDGRYLIYYDFEEGAGNAPRRPAGEARR